MLPHPQRDWLRVGAKLGASGVKCRLSAWKLFSFQEKEMSALKTSSLRDVSQRRTFICLPKLPLMDCWHLLLASEPWERGLGGQEMLSLVAQSC